MNKILSIIALILLFITTVEAQDYTKSKQTNKADIVYETNELLKALEMYKKAYSKSKNKYEKAYIRFQLAEIHRKTLNYKKAASRYKSAIQKGYPDPIAVYYYAYMLQTIMKYDEALIQYEMVPNDSLTEMGIKSCEVSSIWMKNPTRYEIANLRKLNSRESDFSAAFGNALGTEVVFTSGRKRENFTKINKVTGQYYTDIFEVYQNRAKEWEEIKPLNDTINSRYDDGSPSFSSDFTSMYFTRCRTVKHVYLGCQIYEGKRKPGEFFSSSDYVPLVADSLSVGQPSISHDGMTLYFASSMPGGSIR